MDFLILASVFIFGTIIGSFLNVVIYRYNSGTSPLKGRSQCFGCGKTLTWYELIPVLSFILQKGRCRECGVKLSLQYIIVEIVTGLSFIGIYVAGMTIIQSVLIALVFSTLIVIAVYDLRHQIIPDGLVVIFSGLGLVQYFINIDIMRAFSFPEVWTLIAGPLLFFPFWFLWYISKGRWLGLGDGKLSFGIGWFLGASLGASAIMLAFWIGALYALIIIAPQKFFSKGENNLSMQSEIPFGPFLIIGVYIIFFTKINFFDGSITFFNLL